MVQRCTNPKDLADKYYGGRGIAVCDQWRYGENDKTGVECYLDYICENLGPQPSSKHTIDRINNDGNYEPGNIRWAPWSVQMRNRRPRHLSDRGRASISATMKTKWQDPAWRAAQCKKINESRPAASPPKKRNPAPQAAYRAAHREEIRAKQNAKYRALHPKHTILETAP